MVLKAQCAWIPNTNRVAVVGHLKSSERKLRVYDLANTDTPLCDFSLGVSPSSLLPFMDGDTGVLFVAGKGDSNIRYFEMLEEKPYYYPLSEFKSTSAQKGICAIPKYACNVMGCEIMKFLKLDNKGNIVPISFVVPRKSEVFQDDIFPDTPGWTPAQEASNWFSGSDADPKLINLEEVDLGSAKATAFEASESLEDQLAAAKKKIKELEARLAKYE